MPPPGFQRNLLTAFLTIVAGIGGWLSRGADVTTPTAVPTSNGRGGPAEAFTNSTETTGRNTAGQADYVDPAAFSRHEAFDRIFEEMHRDRYGRISAKLVARFYAEAQGLQNKEFPLAMADILRRPWWAQRPASWLASVWAERDPEAARTWLMHTSHRGGGGMSAEFAILEPWARQDPAGMFDWVEAHHTEFPSTRKEFILGTLCQLGAELDPERSLRLLGTIAPSRQVSLFALWAQISPEAAAQRVLAEPDAAVRKSSVIFVAHGWVQHDQDTAAALAWAEKIPDPALAQDALRLIGNNMANEHPAESAGLLARLPQSNDTRQSLGSVVSYWTQKDWEAAARWTLQLPDESLSKWLLSNFPPKDASAKMAALIESLPAESREAAAQRWAAVTAATVKPSATSPAR